MLIECTIKNNVPVIHTFKRLQDGSREHLIDSNFKHYFYVSADRVIQPNSGIYSVQGGFESLDGKKLQKITVKHPKFIGILKRDYNESWESNIPITVRYKIDAIRDYTDYSPRKVWFDIECDDQDGVPSHLKPNKTILSISLVDSIENTPIVFMLGKGEDKQETVKINLKGGSKEFPYIIKFCSTEKQLIESFVSKVKELNPDYLLGWNTRGLKNQNGEFSVGFDLPYLQARSKEIGAHFSDISPLNEIDVNSRGEMHIKGRECPELIIAYKLLKLKVQDFSLNEVVKQDLSASKKETVGSLETWMKEPLKLAEYNVTDTILVKLLDEKLGLSEQIFNMSSIAFSQAEDIGNEVALARNASLKICKNWGKVFLNNEPSHEKFEGAVTFDVIPGIHENVLNFDVESLYPNVIRAFNISPEVVTESEGVLLPSGKKYKQGVQALLPTLINGFYEPRIKFKNLANSERDEEKKQYYKAKSNSYKSLLNSIYGVCVYLFGLNTARSITLTSREVIRFIKKKAEEKELIVCYGDTDSIGVISKKNLEESVVLGKEINEFINDSLEEFMSSYGLTNEKENDRHLKVRFEKIYSRGFWAVKKSGVGAKKRRFAWIAWEEDDEGGHFTKPRVEIKGFETKKAGYSKMYKEIQRGVLMMVCPKEGESRTKDDIDEYLLQRENELLSGKLDINFVCADVNIGNFPKQFFETEQDYTSNNPKRRGIIFGLNYLGLKPQMGKRYKMVYVKSVPEGYPQEFEMDILTHKNKLPSVKRSVYPVDVVVIEAENNLPAGFEVDWEKYVKTNINSPIEGIYESFGWETKKLKKKSINMSKVKDNKEIVKKLFEYG